jgi:hypothetical protein
MVKEISNRRKWMKNNRNRMTNILEITKCRKNNMNRVGKESCKKEKDGISEEAEELRKREDCKEGLK